MRRTKVVFAIRAEHNPKNPGKIVSSSTMKGVSTLRTEQAMLVCVCQRLGEMAEKIIEHMAQSAEKEAGEEKK